MPDYQVTVVEEVKLRHVTIAAGQRGKLMVSPHQWRFTWTIMGNSGVALGSWENLTTVEDETRWQAVTDDGFSFQFLVWPPPSSDPLSIDSKDGSESEALSDDAAMIGTQSEEERLTISSQRLDLLAQAASLKDQGVLNEAEFQMEKERILTSSSVSHTSAKSKSTEVEQKAGGTVPSSERIVYCDRCQFQELADENETGWQCGRCDTNWYVVSCHSCSTVQVVPESLGSLKCVRCTARLSRMDEFLSESMIKDVHPEPKSFWLRKKRSGVIPVAPQVQQKQSMGTSSPIVNSQFAQNVRPVPRKRSGLRKMTWVILLWNLLMIAWIVTGLASNHGNCNGLSQQACSAAHDIGGGIAVGLMVAVWVAGDVILLVLWLITNNGERCPACRTSMSRRATRCERCGFSYLHSPNS